MNNSGSSTTCLLIPMNIQLAKTTVRLPLSHNSSVVGNTSGQKAEGREFGGGGEERERERERRKREREEREERAREREREKREREREEEREREREEREREREREERERERERERAREREREREEILTRGESVGFERLAFWQPGVLSLF